MTTRTYHTRTQPTGAARTWRLRWPWAVVALLAAVSLLLLVTGLLRVLNTAVEQGDALRATARQQGEDFFHCNTLGSATERHACRHLSLHPIVPITSVMPMPMPMPMPIPGPISAPAAVATPGQEPVPDSGSAAAGLAF